MIKKYVDFNDYKILNEYQENSVEDYFTLDQLNIISNMNNSLKGIN